MEYKIITEDHYNDVIRFLRNFFFADEPLNKAANLCVRGEGNSDLERHCIETLKSNLSYMAITTDGQIAGVQLNGILYPGDIERSVQKLEKSNDENFQKIFRLLYNEILKIDYFNKFNIEKIFDIRIISVDSAFRGKGIAKELLKHSENLAKKFSFELIKCECTGIFSQKLVKSSGLEVISEKYYDKYVDELNRPILPVEAPHLKLQLMCKTLNRNEY